MTPVRIPLLWLCAALLHSVTAAQALATVPRPALEPLEPAVRQNVQAALDELARVVEDPAAEAAQRAAAFGQAGRVLHAHHLLDEAGQCYAQAAALRPEVFDWTYLLGVVRQTRDDLGGAAESLRAAVHQDGGYAPARLRLGQVYRELGRLDEAKAELLQARSDPAVRAAAEFELGQLALARREYRSAIEYFESVLGAAPQASRARFPLAMAYRASGEAALAREHLEQRGDGMPALPDPLVDGLQYLAAGARAYIEQALSAVQAGRFDVAAQAFGAAVARSPDDVSTRVRWARALNLIGDRAAARTQLEESLRRDPQHPSAHLYSGALDEEDGNDAQALEHYRAALAAWPGHGPANFFAGNALMRQDQPQQAAAHYQQVIAQAPQHVDAQFLYAMALLRAGALHGEVLAQLEQAHQAFPEDARLTQALARLLAASPDDSVRNGRRAVELADALNRSSPSLEHAAVLAMGYAEIGEFERAVALQADVVARAVTAPGDARVAFWRENLARYRAGQPSRAPWAQGDPAFYPARLRPGGQHASG